MNNSHWSSKFVILKYRKIVPVNENVFGNCNGGAQLSQVLS